MSVEAESLHAAERKALEEAGDHEYSEYTSEYCVEGGPSSDEAMAEKQLIVDKILKQVQADVAAGDMTSLEELFSRLYWDSPWNPNILKSYLPEEDS